MRPVKSYAIAVVASVALHVVVVGALLANWQPDTARIMVQPQFIEAKLVELAPKAKPKPPAPQKPKVDVAKKQNDEKKRLEKLAADKKAQEKKRLQQEQLKKAEQAKKEKQRLEDQRKAEEKKRQEKAAAERERIEAEFAKALEKERSEVKAKNDERVANSYRQLIQQRLSENWSRPPSARLGMETLIRIRLVPTGRIVGVTVLKSSGDIAFDRSVEQAALKVEQFVEIQGMDPGLFERKFRQVDVAFSPEDLRL